jgi:hypothetical protein
MPDCNKDINEENRQAAIKEGTPDYHVDVLVTVIDSAGGTITFVTSGPDPKATHTAKWGAREDMWPACPSTLPSGATKDDAGDPPAIKSEGILYLSKGYVEAERSAGREIYGSDPKPKKVPRACSPSAHQHRRERRRWRRIPLLEP